jgi:hypothetical protein
MRFNPPEPDMDFKFFLARIGNRIFQSQEITKQAQPNLRSFVSSLLNFPL